MNERRPVGISNKNKSLEIRCKHSGENKVHSIKTGECKMFDLGPKDMLTLKAYSEGLPSIPANCPVSINFAYDEGIDVNMKWNAKKEEWKFKIKNDTESGAKDPKEVNVTIGEPEK